MRIFYSAHRKPGEGNFGDDLNEWLWHRLAPDLFASAPEVTFSGIGTIIGPRMKGPGPWIVFGSGVGYGPPPSEFGGDGWDVVCVRGPLSARILGLAPEAACTDPAILLSALPEFAPAGDAERHGVVFVPHHEALAHGDWESVCAAAGVEFLSPRLDCAQVLRRLRTAKLVIADAMHAAICAAAMRTPWVPVRTSREISTFKWADWTLSLGLPYEPTYLPASTTQEAVRSACLKLHGRDFTVDDPTEAGILAHFRQDARRKTRRSWPIQQRLGKKVDKAILQPVIASPLLSAWQAGQDARRRDAAARVLSECAVRAGFLSDPSLSASLTRRLLGELRSLETEYAGPRKASA